MFSRLDDALFREPDLVDYRIRRTRNALDVRALVSGSVRTEEKLADILEGFFPTETVMLSVSSVAEEDHALYSGKRRILPQEIP